MTGKELAEKLDGTEYDKLVNFHSNMEHVYDSARDNNLVIVFGASDDLMEFRGAIDDEADCYGGGIVMVNKNGTGFDAISKNCIEAIWDRDNVAWQYETDIPHETFKVMEDGQVYCIGIVFSLDDLN